MPFYTKHYNLEAFKWGEIYSSRSDERRFTIIDNQLAFLSDMVGDGIITGWDISNNEDGTVSISPGMGLIDRRVIQSFGGFEISLSSNAIHYIYMLAKEGEVGGTSGNSNMANVEGIDSIAPSSPSGLQQESSISNYLSSLSSYDADFLTYLRRLMGRGEEDASVELLSYKEIAFSWSANSEPDFSHYKVIRIDGSDITILGTTTETIYVDIELEQNREYSYQVITVDLSGNESDSSDIDISTAIDDRIPMPPIFVQAFPSDQTLEVIWDNSASDNILAYRVSVQLQDDNYVSVGNPTVADVSESSDSDFGSTYIIFENMENNRNYEVTVYSVSISSVFSEGISVRTFLSYNPGAGEINNIDVEFSISSFENVGIETDIVWRYDQSDPYLSYAYKFIITFIESGSRFSEPIEILESISRLYGCPDDNDGDGICYSSHIKYIPYIVNDDLQYESIKQYTPYLILIQTEDEDGNLSNGVVTRISRTIISEPVPAVQNFSIERKADNSIFLSWTNPTESYFSHNLITISIVDLSSQDIDGTAYVENLRIDKSNTFTISSESFNVSYRYNINIVSYDVFGSIGEGYETFQQFIAEEGRLLPSSPGGLELFTGDTQLNLRWDPDTSEAQELEFYKVYRATFQFYLRPSDFSLLATMSSVRNDFTDYSVSNEITYTYFVTAVDIYGNESVNPIADNYMPSGLISATPSEGLSLSPPAGLTADVNSNNSDVELSWDASSGFFDGYEILKSIGNNYSFVVIDYVPISQITYIDTDSALKNGENYYYLVRKYKSETNISVTSSAIAPSASVFIGKVTTSNGTNTVSIDVSNVVNLENFVDPLTTKTNAAIEVHHHTNDEGVDKRIELRSNVHVSEWATNDYQVYSTEEDIEGASSYILHISGTLNEDYFTTNNEVDVASLRQAQAGESPVLYEIDTDNNKIVFNEPLYSVAGSFVAPYSQSPTISLELFGVSEVDNYLPVVHIGDLSATQFRSGQFNSAQMPAVDHEGRKGERLLPLRLPMQTLDNFVYSIAAVYDDADRNEMGDAVTFYDFISIEGERVLSATSNGIWLSDNYGNDWNKVSDFSEAVHRLYKSTAGDYYAITNYGVYKSGGSSFRQWGRMAGLDYVKVIRDITGDSRGNLYITTDLGVFRLNSENVPYIEDTWEKLSLFGPRSSETYAILYDETYIEGSIETSNRILVSNELGLLQSLDEGRSWNYISDLESLIKVRKFIKDDNYIFALSDTAIYREETGTDVFLKIADLDVNISRKMEIFNSNIYVNTDNGAKVSTSSNIYIDTGIEFAGIWSLANINNNTAIITAINGINNDLFVGMDRKLYLLDDSGKFWLQYEQKNTTVPSFYVNSVLQKLGYYYNNSGSNHNVSFDEVVNHEYIVEAVNKYDIYTAEYGGWVYNKYNAKFVVYQNNIQFGESRDEIEIDMGEFIDVVIPTYTDNNAHEAQADIYKAQLQTSLDQLAAIEEIEGNQAVDVVVDIYANFELFLSQLYEDARVVTDSAGNTSNFILPSISTDLVNKRTSISNSGVETEIEDMVYTSINNIRNTDYSISINVVDGMFVFGLPFDKYDNLTLDILDTTIKNAGEYSHRELEDSFEYAYSGPSSYLSQVQQVNLVKLGIFSEIQWPGQQTVLSPPFQMDTIIPVNEEWYDNLNSTINYTKEVYNENLSLSISYPSTVAYISATNNILVGGRGGVISINRATLEIDEVNFGSIANQMVRSIFQSNDNIYILTDKNIFISTNDGVSWSEYNRSGLPNYLYSIGSLHNNLLIGASDGIYIKLSDSDAIDWEKVMDSSSPVSVMYSSNILFSVIDKKIYISSNGFTYTDTEVGSDLDVTNINRYGYTTTYISTNQGLYSDNGTFNSLSPKLEEIDLGELLTSTTIATVNDTVTNNTDKIIIGVSNGDYGVIQEDMLKIKESTSLDSIHKIIIINDDIWLFGQDACKVSFLDYPIKLSTGAPM